jgi:hypothetical protein
MAIIGENLNILVDAIADNYGKGHDFVFKKRIENLIISTYATLIKREYEKTGQFAASLQTAIKIEMEKVDDDVCSTVVGDIGCKLMRSKLVIPSVLRVKRGDLFAYVGNIEYDNSYGQINPEDWKLIKYGSKFIAGLQYYSYYNKYIYSYNQSNNFLIVRAVFADPRELLTYLNCDTNVPCIEQVDIPMDMQSTIREMIYKEIAGGEDDNVELKDEEQQTTR